MGCCCCMPPDGVKVLPLFGVNADALLLKEVLGACGGANEEGLPPGTNGAAVVLKAAALGLKAEALAFILSIFLVMPSLFFILFFEAVFLLDLAKTSIISSSLSEEDDMAALSAIIISFGAAIAAVIGRALEFLAIPIDIFYLLFSSPVF